MTVQQTLVLEHFPEPKTARALSPNGRAHWATKSKQTEEVKKAVALKALAWRFQPMRGLVVIQPTFIYPVARKRDDDNLATGVMKAVRDALVQCHYLEADDTDHVRQLPAIPEVQKGRRALILTFTYEALAAGGTSREGGTRK